MTSLTKTLQFWAEVALLNALRGAARLVPLRWVSVPGDLLGWFVVDIFRYKRKLALRNLSLALGDDVPETERVRIGRRCYRFFGGLALEILAMGRIPKDRLDDYLILDNPEVIDEALTRGHGVVLVSGHIGNWELMGGGLSSSGRALSMYVGRQHNPRADAMLNRIRRMMGTETFPKGAAVRGILKALHAGRIVAMLSDQHHVHKKHYIRFFGQPVSTVPGPASFARHSGAALVFGYCTREGRFRYRVQFREIPYHVTDSEEQDVLTISQAIARALEEQIRRFPDQYFWMHNRWRGISPKIQLSPLNLKFLSGADAAPSLEGGGNDKAG